MWQSLWSHQRDGAKFDFPMGEKRFFKCLLSPALSSSYRWRRGRWELYASAVVGCGYRGALAKKVRARRESRPTMINTICEGVGCLDQGP
jgi:hypothetical protein